jgi:hypothetical protein
MGSIPLAEPVGEQLSPSFGATAANPFTTATRPDDPYRYQIGFGNRFYSEAVYVFFPYGHLFYPGANGNNAAPKPYRRVAAIFLRDVLMICILNNSMELLSFLARRLCSMCALPIHYNTAFICDNN